MSSPLLSPKTKYSFHALEHRWQTQGPWAKSGLHLVLSGLAPCFYSAVALSSRLTTKEKLHLCSPKITFSPLKATARLMWPPVEMNLTPLP